MNERIKTNYETYLKEEGSPVKIPYIETVPELTEKIKVKLKTDSIAEDGLQDYPHAHTLRDVNIKQNRKTRENTVQVYQRGLTLQKFGRLRGNMEYLEDCWDVQISPPAIKFAYILNNTITLTEAKQMRIRDKYLKVRVRYDGTKYAIINGIRTQYTISYA